MADDLTASDSSEHLRELVADVAAAYFGHPHVNATDIPAVISEIAKALGSVSASPGEAEAPSPAEPAHTRATPAQIRQSVTPDALISFETGKPFRTLKRHLSVLGLTPAEYRQKWGLPRDYPMTAPNYSAHRSQMAKSLGLGRKAAAPPPAPKSRGRAKKSARPAE